MSRQALHPLMLSTFYPQHYDLSPGEATSGCAALLKADIISRLQTPQDAKGVLQRELPNRGLESCFPQRSLAGLTIACRAQPPDLMLVADCARNGNVIGV